MSLVLELIKRFIIGVISLLTFYLKSTLNKFPSVLKMFNRPNYDILRLIESSYEAILCRNAKKNYQFRPFE